MAAAPTSPRLNSQSGSALRMILAAGGAPARRRAGPRRRDRGEEPQRQPHRLTQPTAGRWNLIGRSLPWARSRMVEGCEPSSRRSWSSWAPFSRRRTPPSERPAIARADGARRDASITTSSRPAASRRAFVRRSPTGAVALEAWRRSAANAFRFEPAAESDAIVRLYWAGDQRASSERCSRS